MLKAKNFLSQSDTRNYPSICHLPKFVPLKICVYTSEYPGCAANNPHFLCSYKFHSGTNKKANTLSECDCFASFRCQRITTDDTRRIQCIFSFEEISANRVLSTISFFTVPKCREPRWPTEPPEESETKGLCFSNAIRISRRTEKLSLDAEWESLLCLLHFVVCSAASFFADGFSYILYCLSA